jgi:EF hand domain-containing protein
MENPQMKSQLVVVAAALLSSAALAQSPPADRGDLRSDPFNVFDKDSDGNISRQEAQSSAVLSQSFARIDANADGQITRAEFSAVFGAKQAEPGTGPASPPPR